jgi:hypothetical protein
MLDKRKYHEKRTNEHQRTWDGQEMGYRARRAVRGGRARAESMKIKMKVHGGTRLVLRIRAG